MHTIDMRGFVGHTGHAARFARVALLAVLGAAFLTLAGRMYVASGAGSDFPEPIGTYLD